MVRGNVVHIAAVISVCPGVRSQFLSCLPNRKCPQPSLAAGRVSPLICFRLQILYSTFLLPQASQCGLA